MCKLREDDQGKDGCAQRTAPGEEPQVADGLRPHEQQTEKCACRGEAAEDDGFGQVADGGAHIPFVTDMVQEVQGIVDGDAQQHRPESQ